MLALFVAVPPFIDVARMAPAFAHWFIDLAWVRLITLRPQRYVPKADGPDIIFPLILEDLETPPIMSRVGSNASRNSSRNSSRNASRNTRWGGTADSEVAGFDDDKKPLISRTHTSADTTADPASKV
jgi:hypothetical protein